MVDNKCNSSPLLEIKCKSTYMAGKMMTKIQAHYAKMVDEVKHEKSF